MQYVATPVIQKYNVSMDFQVESNIKYAMVATPVIQEYNVWLSMDTDTVETTKNKNSVLCNIILVLDEHNKMAIIYIVLNITSQV